MITYDKDGVTLIDGSGNRVSPFSGKPYSDLLAILDLQIAAKSENSHQVDLYTQALHNAQTSIDAGRAADAPVKPLQKVVSDTGDTTYVAFSPVLPDLVVPPKGPMDAPHIAVPSVDTQAIMYAMITAIYRKMFPTS